MKNFKFLFIAFTLFTLASCTIEVEDPNLASQIIGTYTMDTYETHSGISTPNANDKIIVTRLDDTHADIEIDYASALGNDISLPNVSIVKSGDAYQLDRNFDNADVTGDVSGESMTLILEYTNGNFANITASK